MAMNDKEISKLVDAPRGTVNSRRTSSFERLQKMLGVIDDEQN
jgi:DNA-directed RNA polymerase specialized sigma24 family protein